MHLSILKYLLIPFSATYGAIMNVRNYLYDKGIRRSFHFDTTVVSVGNLKVGGSGKTPHIEYLTKLLKPYYYLAILSRGYKRKSKGFILADQDSTWQHIGDEPMQYVRKFYPEVAVAVAEDRALAIPSILLEQEKTQIILLDDAYQHRSVVPDLNLMLTEYDDPFYSDLPFPAGLLREPRKGARRADAIIVTKSPESLPEWKKTLVLQKIQPYIKAGTPIFFSFIKYLPPLPVYPDSKLVFSTNVFLFAGTASSKKLQQEISRNYSLIQALDLQDHLTYTVQVVDAIIKKYEACKLSDMCLLTTEKDMVKLHDPAVKNRLIKYPLFYIPIEITFRDATDNFNDFILERVKKTIN